MNRRFGSLILLAICTPLIAAPNTKPQEISGWGEAIDPDGDCQVTERDGDVTITVRNTHHDLTYTDEYTKLNSPRIVQAVDGDFTLQVTVHAFPMPGDVASSGGRFSFVSSGLLIWVDDKNFIRFERSRSRY